SVSGNYLIAGANPPADSKDKRAISSSKRLEVMDRHSGQVLWGVTAEVGFRNNAICVGGGRLFCIDRASSDYLSTLRRHGDSSAFKPSLRAFDLATGQEAWSTDDAVFGTCLSYSDTLGVLVESGRMGGDTLSDEPPGVRAHAADNGSVLWYRKDLGGPALIH